MVLKTYARLFTEDMDRSLAFLQTLLGKVPDYRFSMPEAGIEVAGIGDICLVGGDAKTLAPLEAVVNFCHTARLSSQNSRKPYPADVSDEEWAFVAPYLTLMTPDAPQRLYPLREVFNGLRYVVKTGCPWRWMPHDLPPWDIVYYQAQRWIKAGVFAPLVHDLRAVLRLQAGRQAQPTAAILDSRTVQSTPESGARSGYDGAKKKKGSKVHIAVDTLGYLLALHVTPAHEQDRAQGSALAAQVQQVTGDNVAVAVTDREHPRF